MFTARNEDKKQQCQQLTLRQETILSTAKSKDKRQQCIMQDIRQEITMFSDRIRTRNNNVYCEKNKDKQSLLIYK